MNIFVENEKTFPNERNINFLTLLCHFFADFSRKKERTTTNKKFTSISLDFTEFSIFSTSLSCFLAPFASFFCVATREWKITHMRNFLQYFINKLFSRFHCLFAWSAERVLWLGTRVGGLGAACTLRWWRIYQPQCQTVSKICLFCESFNDAKGRTVKKCSHVSTATSKLLKDRLMCLTLSRATTLEIELNWSFASSRDISVLLI